MLKPGEVLSYLEMCTIEGASLQRGMNWRLHPTHSVVLMSRRPGAPYADEVVEEGRTLVYEGHDVPRSEDAPQPKAVDQASHTPLGGLTQNGLFLQGAEAFKAGEALPEKVRVYEKIRQGLWVYNGVFALTDAWQEASGGRKVFKFRLELLDEEIAATSSAERDVPHGRLIPTEVKLAVWKRDGGRCVKCGSRDNLHFDHTLPFSRGGTSLLSENIQLLCARHNLEKSNRIE